MAEGSAAVVAGPCLPIKPSQVGGAPARTCRALTGSNAATRLLPAVVVLEGPSVSPLAKGVPLVPVEVRIRKMASAAQSIRKSAEGETPPVVTEDTAPTAPSVQRPTLHKAAARKRGTRPLVAALLGHPIEDGSRKATPSPRIDVNDPSVISKS